MDRDKSINLSSKKFKTNPNFLLREIGDECVLVPIGEAGIFNNSLLSLNETSQFLWKMFQTPISLEEAINKAKKEYATNDIQLEHDIYDFINAYLQVGLLEEE